MICDIKNNAVKALAKLVRKRIIDSDTFGKNELRELIQDVADLVESENDNIDQAMAFARMVPQLVGLNMQLAPKLMKKIDGKPGFIYDLAHDFAQENGLEKLEDYLGIEDAEDAAETRKATKKANKQRDVELRLEKQFSRIHRYDKIKTKVPPILYATETEMFDKDGNILPDHELNYNVLRKVLDLWNENPMQTEERAIDEKFTKRIFEIKKTKGRTTLVATRYQDLMDNYPESKKESDEFGPNDIVLVVADQNGNYLEFDTDGALKQNGKVAYYALYNGRGKEKDVLNYMSITRYRKPYAELEADERDELKNQLALQQEAVDTIKTYLRDNPGSELVMDLIGGSYGKSPYDTLSKFKFTAKKPFKPKVSTSHLSKGVPYDMSSFDFDGVTYYFRSKEGFTNEDAETVTSLLFDKIKNEDGTPLTIKERRAAINKIMYTGRVSDDNVTLVNNPNFVVKFKKDGTVQVKARMQKGGVKTDISAKSLVDITDSENVREIILDHLKELGFYNVSKIYIDNASVHTIPTIKQNKSGTKTLVNKEQNYLDWLKSDKFMIVNPTAGTNPYFLFEPSEEVEDLIGEVELEEDVKKKGLPKSYRDKLDEMDPEEVSQEFKDAVDEANQNMKDDRMLSTSFFDGYKPAADKSGKTVYKFKKQLLAKGFKGKSVIDLVDEGLSTRYTVYKQQYENIGSPKVGEYFWMVKPATDKSNKKISEKKVLVKVTAIYDRTDKRWEDNFYKEGWEDSVLDYLSKAHRAIEFEKVDVERKRKKTITVEEKRKEAPSKKEKVTKTKSTTGKAIDNEIDLVNEFGELEKTYDIKGREIPASKEQINEALKWWENHPISKAIRLYYPAMDDKQAFQTMFNAINLSNPNAVARWSRDGIVLLHGADYSDIYHEAWHGFSQTFLTQEQRDSLYTEVSKYEGEFTDYNGNKVRFDEATELQLEEYLAESFREYVLKNGTSTDKPTTKKMNIFKRIYAWIRSLFEKAGLVDVANPTEVFTVKEAFEKMRIGNITEYTHDVEKRSYGELFHVMRPTNPAERSSSKFNYQKTKTVVDSIDSVWSEYVDQMIRKKGNNKYAVTAYKSEKNKLLLYNVAYSMFQRRLEDYETQLAKMGKRDPKAAEIRNKIILLQDIIKNFGDLESLSANAEMRSGAIYAHMMKSKILSAEDKEEFMQDVKEAQNNREPGYDRSGQDFSLQELASEEVIYLLKSLNDFDSSGKKITNDVGIAKLAEFDKIWNLLARNLENSINIDVMYDKLQDLAQKNKSIRQLLDKMGPLETDNVINMNLWTNFWDAFNKTRVPLIQMNVNERTGDEKYLITLGYAQGEYRKVMRQWRDTFNSRITNYIKEQPIAELKKERIIINKNYLDLDVVLDDYPSPPTDPQDVLDFLGAIGIKLDDNLDIRKELKDPAIKSAVAFTYDRLVKLKKHNVSIESVDDIFMDHEISETLTLENMMNRLNDFAKLQAKFGDSVSNFMVSTATGDTQFEHSLNNSMLVIANSINDTDNEQDLYLKGYMNHLDPERNVWTKRAIWRRSLWQEDGTKRSTSGKIGNVTMRVENVSGITKIDVKGISEGVKTAESDPFTKLSLDFHTLILRGTPELMKHSDKGSSYTAFVDDIVTYENKEEKTKYIDDADFLLMKNGTLAGNKQSYGQTVFVSMLHDYLASEMERIYISRKTLEEKDGSYDYAYAKRGSQFVVFDGILKKKTKDSLYKLLDKWYAVDDVDVDFQEWLEKNNATLAEKVNNEILQYLLRQKQAVQDYMQKAKYIDQTVYSKIKTSAKRKTRGVIEPGPITRLKNETTVADAAVMSFVANSWIHNMESMIMLYGDLALYDMAKEEFHKRNAGIASTGQLFRTDMQMMDFLSKMGADQYTAIAAKRLNINIPSQDYINADGSMKTAVMADPKALETEYLPEYKAALEKYFNDRYKDKTKVNKAVNKALEAYTDRKEGDAQGWITFDAYRKLLIMEGKWDWDVQESLYQKIVNEEDVDMEKALKFFPVKKLQYWGPLQSEGLPMMAMHKFSLMPLTPNIIKGTNLEKLHDKMISEGIGYATFKSGSKMSTVTNPSYSEDATKADPFYSNVQKRTLASEEFTPNIIYVQYLKDQLDTGEEFKVKMTFPSQMRKLIIDSLVENGVPTDFRPEIKDNNKRVEAWEKATASDKKTPNYKLYTKFESLIGELTNTKYRELLDRIGWKVGKDGKPYGDQRALMDYVVLNLELQDVAAHELDFIKIGPDGRIKNDLSISFSAEKIERLLNAIVVREIIRQKVRGESLVQVARTGWEKPTAKDIAKYGNDLPFYNINKKTGKTNAMKVKIAMQGDFKNLLQLEQVRELAETENIDRLQALNMLLKDEKWLKDNRKMITMTAVRIPTQGINSMEFMEVQEFLPEDAGHILIMPSEIVAKTGSDFDIDKMFTMMPHIHGKYGNVKYVEHGKRITPEEAAKLINQKNKLEDQRQDIYDEYENKINGKEIRKQYGFSEEQAQRLQRMNSDFRSTMARMSKKINELERLEARRAAGKVSAMVDQLLDSELYDAYTERDMFLDQHYAEKGELLKEANRELTERLQAERDKKLEPLNKKLFDVTFELKSASSRGTENEIITSIREILETPQNFVNLIKPNATDIFDDLAKEMAQYTLEYDPKAEAINGEGRKINEKGDEEIYGTRPLEIMYNLYKLDSNNVGKQTLGIGAVENTYNVLMNRIGMYMNPTSGMELDEYKAKLKELKKMREEFQYYKKGGKAKYRKPSMSKSDMISKMATLSAEVKNFGIQRLMLSHNKMKKNGKDVISLSHMYDANNEHRISDVISQMINGWVDVAKDTWIFNIGGNKELSPTILFMVQAGVPIKEAVYFAAQPLVREYVERQRLRKSTMSGPFGTEPENPLRWNYDAKLDILTKYGIVEKKIFKKKVKDPATGKFIDEKISYYDSSELFEETENKLKFHKNDFNMETMKKRLDKFKKDGKVTETDKAMFLHFLEVENMAKALTAFKRTLNPDTARARTLFEAAAKEAAIVSLKSNKRIPTEMIDKISTDTSISSFFDALGYQQDIWGPNFLIRNSKELKDYIMGMLGGPQAMDLLQNTYEEPEKFANMFLNDFMVYLFQNKLYDFDIVNIESYKGAEMTEDKGKVTAVKYLPSGVMFDKGKFYVDKNQLGRDYQNLDTKQQEKEYPFAEVDSNMFAYDKQYFKFVFEREYLRSMYSFPYMEKTFLYKERRDAIENENARKAKGERQSSEELDLKAYEEVLRDMALKNVYNIQHMFNSTSTGMADTLELIKAKFPDLVENYPVLQSMGIVRSGTTKNIKLYDRSTDSDSLNIYHENMLELMDPANIRVNASKEDMQMLADFFNKMPFFSVLQSGFDTNTMLSLQRIMPYQGFVDFMTSVVEPFTRTKNRKTFTKELIDEFMRNFLMVNDIRKNRKRGKFKNYTLISEMSVEELISGEDFEVLESEEKMRTEFDYEGNLIFSPAKRDKDSEDLVTYVNSIADDIRRNPDRVYLFNDAVDPKVDHLASAKNYDWILKKVKDRHPDIAKRIIGIPSRKNYDTRMSNAVVADNGNDPNGDFVKKVDAAIAKVIESGLTPVFHRYGYGQVLIGASERGVLDSASKVKKAPKNFDYLSHQLLKNFGYMNLNYSNEKEIKQIQKVVYSKQDYLDKIKFCFSI